jgi:site-specific DNA-methyltransferase (cytosine-N4-specific)
MQATSEQFSLPILHPPSKSVVYQGDALEIMKRLPSEICRTAVTSPPYWGLRDYDDPRQIGSEEKVEEYIERLVEIFRELKRVLTQDGTLWLNVGDSYTSGGRTRRAPDKKNRARAMDYRAPTPEGLKPKELVGIPWRLAMALQADGWYLRSDIIWHKPNPLPESVKDRPTRAHEYIFLISKSEQYYYDYQAVQERGIDKKLRNKRSVWSVNTKPFNGAHFATFPPDLITPCILAGSAPGDTVIDPFFGSGTTGLVAFSYGRPFIGIEIKSEYIGVARKRLNERSITFDVVET